MKLHFLLLAAAIPVGTMIPCASGEVPTRDELRNLVKKADDWEVPQPAANAVLVKVHAYSSGVAGTPLKDYYWLGFLEPQHQGRLLQGFDEKEISAGRDIKVVRPPIDCTDVVAVPRSNTNSTFIAAIQLLRRGDEKAAAALIEHSRKQDAGNPGSLIRIPANQPAVITLARNCLADAINDIASPEPDFPQILQRIERLQKDQPELAGTSNWTADRLRSAINHPVPAPGSMEAVIEDYIKCGAVHGEVPLRRGSMPPAEQALVLRGFEAIPAILQQIGSNRATNHLMKDARAAIRCMRDRC